MINATNVDAGQHTTCENSHYRAVRTVLAQVLGLNLLVTAAKIIVGLLTGSISMVADGVHSATDAASNVVGLIGSQWAGRPADEDHPYGHHKYETFATLGIGLLLVITSWGILQSILTRVTSGGTPEVGALSFGVMLVTLVINLGVMRYERRRGDQLQSQLLLADATHTQSDIFVSLSVIGSLIAVLLGWVWVDVVVACVIFVIVAWAGLQIIYQAAQVLSDTIVIDPAVVEETVLSIDAIESCHKIRSRGTEQSVYLDLHIRVDPHMTIEQAHRLDHYIQDYLKQRLNVTDVIIHLEPARLT